jgi:Domain of unknown function (DUF4267)
VTLALVISAVCSIGATFLVFCALRIIRLGEPALEAMAHPRASLVPVFAGRYLMMAFILMAFVAMQEWRALAVILAGGCVMGFYDLFFVRKVGGMLWPHAFAGILCFVLAAGAFSLSRA